SLRQPASLSCWLHGVSYRTATRLRANRLVGLSPETELASPSSPDPLAELTLRELYQILDEELHQLPERLGAPLLLCYLQGRTGDEAARQLGWSRSTLKRRLER